ncbi:MAG: hypothetical protein G8345_14660 [Magnetococcales bacterium]|nr:hypothetical protein [Magnetococcales bacterium]NGZ28118.1 hypothetical protein [Magnetococcales bacterium]
MMDGNLAQVLERELNKAGKPYLTLSALKRNTSFCRLLNVDGKATNTSVAGKLRPLLPDGLEIRTGAGILYLCRKIGVEALILDKMQRQKGGAGSKGILRYLPVGRSEGILALNQLLAQGRLLCQINDNHECRFLLAPDRAATPLSQEGDKRQFFQAYGSLGGSKGRGFIFIHQIRKRLGWPQEVFDTTLETLLKQDVVEGQQGNPALLDPQQIHDSYRDPQGRLLVTLTWWGEEP